MNEEWSLHVECCQCWPCESCVAHTYIRREIPMTVVSRKSNSAVKVSRLDLPQNLQWSQPWSGGSWVRQRAKTIRYKRGHLAFECDIPFPWRSGVPVTKQWLEISVFIVEDVQWRDACDSISLVVAIFFDLVTRSMIRSDEIHDSE